jgi:hypothetical protein
MACSMTTKDKCEACYNWGPGKIRARALNKSAAPNDCKTNIGLVVDGCKYYKGTVETITTTVGIDTCHICQKSFLKWFATSSTASCDNLDTDKCLEIDHCETTVCFTPSTGPQTSGCRMCSSGYSGANWDTVNGSGSALCAKAIAITNCDYVEQISTTVKHCYACGYNFAVTFNDLLCSAFTADSNCRKLGSSNAGCWYCWHSYYWDSDHCRLGAGLNRF